MTNERTGIIKNRREGFPETSMEGAMVKSFFKPHWLEVLLTASLFFLFLLGGCALTQQDRNLQYSPFVNSLEVEGIFYSRTILPDHDYYFTGSEGGPDAILAVAKDVRFTKGLWSSIDLTKEKLNFWMTFIDGDTSNMNCTWYSRYIVDPDGRRVALYYSKYYYTVVKFPEPGSLVVYPPDPISSGIGFGFRGNCP